MEQLIEHFTLLTENMKLYMKSGRFFPPSQFCVYFILNKINNKFYIGSTALLTKRRKNHFKTFRGKRHTNKHLQNAVNKYGVENFEFIPFEYYYFDKIFKKSYIREYLESIETYYIKLYNPHYNFNKEGSSSYGVNLRELWGQEKYNIYIQNQKEKMKNHPRRDEIYKKISDNRKGKTWKEWYGEEKAEEIRKSQIIRLTGKKRPEHSEWLKINQIGRKLSEETKKKISESLKNRKRRQNG